MPPEPLVLGFDTSAAHCAVVLLSGNKLVAERFEAMRRGQAERLFPLLEEVLSEAGAAWAGLTALGVGIGPGNFTGIRISVAAARGLALSLAIPAVGVSAFEAAALGAPRPTVVALDAHRDMLYAQRLTEAAASPPVLISAADLPDFAAGAQIITPEPDVAPGLGTAHPAHSLAQAIALIAAARWSTDSVRPAPLYIRSADATPPRQAPPKLLP